MDKEWHRISCIFLNFGKGRLGFRFIGNVFDMDLLYLKLDGEVLNFWVVGINEL